MTALLVLALNVLTLDQAVETAERNQPQLRAARAQTRAAEARAGEAFAPLLPQLVGTAAYERTTANSAPRPGLVPLGVTSASAALRGATFDTFNFWNFDLHLSQLVWDFQSVDRYRSVRETAEATEATERVTRQTVLLNVRTAYFTARAQKALVEVARETLANQDLHLGQVEGFVRVGTQPEIALATARTNRANAAFQLINAENNYDIARAQLNQAMGVEGATDYDVADEAIAPIPGEDASTDELVREAVEARP